MKTISIFVFILISFNIYPQSILINEVMSSNSATIADFEGDFPDWIELYNTADATVYLYGFGLSDDPNEPFKWTFPNVALPSNDHLLLFASDKDITDIGTHWETVIDHGDEWNYFQGSQEPPSNWNQSGFDDASWIVGSSGFGYGDGDDNTIVSQTTSVYIRKVFNTENLGEIVRAAFHVDYDDAFVAYINGTEICRANIGVTGTPPTFDQTANEGHEALMYQGGNPEYFAFDANLLGQGENVIAIQVHNVTAESSDLTIIPFLSLLLTNEPDNPNGSPEILQLEIPNLHTNFKINSAGETIILSTANGTIADSISTGMIPTDISLGRHPDGDVNWFYFDEPTPNTENNPNGYQDIAEEPLFSVQGGFFDNIISVELSVNSPNTAIYYTTDGSEPTPNSLIYSNPVQINETVVIRARTFAAGHLPSIVVSNSYFINSEHDLPVISISTDPANFFDYYTGIYADGPNASDDFPHFGANFWNDWERPVNIEMYENTNELAFNIQAGAKIFGGWSRGNAQKSISIFARGTYGYNEIDYQIFPDKPIDSFEAIVLRNSGQDWNSTMIRDALLTNLIADCDIEIQAYRPAVLYINGEYWGIHNIREKINEHFVASNSDSNANEIDILEGNAAIVQGDNQHYGEMMYFVEHFDMSNMSYYENVASKMDIENYITYQAAQIFFNNTDWPGNNIKYWRPQTPTGKWRWILYDTDFGFGIWNVYDYMNNTLVFATDDSGPGWPNPPWATLLFRRLLYNESFQTDFINRFCDILNTNFLPVNIINKINTKAAVIESEIPIHNQRWDYYISDWSNNVNLMRTFASNRSNHMKSHLQSFFSLSAMNTISLGVSPVEAGLIQLNTLELNEFYWQGEYFGDVPITLTALPSIGFRFIGWEGLSQQEESVTLYLTQDLNVQALFEEVTADTASVVINEINYHSSDEFNPEDWIELFNSSSEPVDISSWQFKDSNDEHVFEFPQNTILEEGEYLVVCQDTLLFNSAFPEVENYIGNFDFGLSASGEELRIFNLYGLITDLVNYDDENDWPLLPDGNGNTLELADASYNNSLPESWQASVGHGTPGTQNSEGVTEANDELQITNYELNNYPNPFNPVTTISFNISRKDVENAKVEIYNIKGQRVEQIPVVRGQRSVVWDAEKFSSGVYFYKLNVQDSPIKKMILLK